MKLHTAYETFGDAGSRVMTDGFAFLVVYLPARMLARSAGRSLGGRVEAGDSQRGCYRQGFAQRLPHAFLCPNSTQNALCVGMPCPLFSSPARSATCFPRSAHQKRISEELNGRRGGSAQHNKDRATLPVSLRTIRDCLIIAFITRNSNLVPLLEGLCSSNPYRFE